MLKAYGSKLIHADGHDKCLSKLKINFRSKTHCDVCNMSFSPEKNVLTIDSYKFPLNDRWMAQKGIDPDRYKYEVHINCMKKIKKEVSDLVSENSSATSTEFGSSIETLSATPTESRSSIETSSATSSTSIDYGQIFHDLLTECEFKEVKGDKPGHIPGINEKASDAYFEFTQLNGGKFSTRILFAQFGLHNTHILKKA